MKWLVLTCFLLWARHGEGGALKCLPEDSECISQIAEEVEQKEIDIRRPSGSTDAPAECLTDTEWDSHCHRCRCVAGEAQCERRLECESIEDPIRCKPNTTFERECNSCLCLESGLGLCTVEECQREPTKAPAPSKPKIPRGVDCAPGTTWQSQCNDCVCSPEGYRYCTERACGSQETERPLRCAPQSQWLNDCNLCWCSSGRAVCTKMGCVGLPSDMHFEEQKETREKQKSPVPVLKSAKNSTKKVCVENRMFILNCNTCWCNEDGTSYFCTRKVCAPGTEEPVIEEGSEKLRVIKKECRPGEVFEVDCNMCRCNPDGKSYSCTRRACFDEEAKNQTVSRKTRATPQEPPKNCQPGQKFRMDCNQCLCDNEGQNFSCTRIDCAALNNQNGNRRRRDVSQKVVSDCVPGTVFDQGCNVCRCTADGGHASCTLKRCPSNENATLTATESSFRCNPGEQFKQSCNDCSCSADGKSVFCTLLVCDDDLTPEGRN